MNFYPPKLNLKAPDNVVFSLTHLLNNGEYIKTLKYCINLINKFPKDEQIHYIMGLAYYFSQDFAKSSYHFKYALKLKPNFYQALNNLGIIHNEYAYKNNNTNLSEIKKSILYFKSSIKINSNYAYAYENLATTYFKIGEYLKAVKAYEKASKLKKLTNEDNQRFIISQKKEDLIPETLKYIQSIQTEKYNPNLILHEISLTYTILPNKKEIFKQRNRLVKSITKYDSKKLSNLNIDISLNPKIYLFHLSYDGQPTKEIFQKQGDFFQKNIPEVNLYKKFHRKKNKKIKIGVFTKFLDNHPVSYCFIDNFLSLNSNHFEVIIFTTDINGKKNLIKKKNKIISKSKVKFQTFNDNDLNMIRDTICKKNIDILIYPEVGLTGTSYYLAAHRLAKKQIALSGHPDTTGLSTIDYYIGNKLNQPKNAQLYYTEKLVLFENAVLSGSPLEKEIESIPRNLELSDFNLSKEKKYYGCLQSLFKIHPEFDEILNEIVLLDPKAIIVLTVFPNKSAVINLLKRWKSKFPNLLNRCIFLKRLSYLKYLRIVELMDVHLDTIHFGMGSTANQVLNLKKPIVSWQGKFARCRKISSIYKKFNFKNCPLVENKKNFSKIAVTWANDENLQNQFKLEVEDKYDELFTKNYKIKDEFENFFKKISKTI